MNFNDVRQVNTWKYNKDTLRDLWHYTRDNIGTNAALVVLNFRSGNSKSPAMVSTRSPWKYIITINNKIKDRSVNAIVCGLHEIGHIAADSRFDFKCETRPDAIQINEAIYSISGEAEAQAFAIWMSAKIKDQHFFQYAYKTMIDGWTTRYKKMNVYFRAGDLLRRALPSKQEDYKCDFRRILSLLEGEHSMIRCDAYDAYARSKFSL